jgi:ATPase subunit of ABC transporter with duplicated ATPase domains
LRQGWPIEIPGRRYGVNHLDLDSIATIEAVLCGFDGALMVVSHDEAFLQAIGITRYISLGE